MSDFASRLKQLREQNGETQTELADYLNVTHTAVSYFENRKRRDQSIDIYMKIADHYGVSLDYLLGYAVPPINSVTKHEAALLEAYRRARPHCRNTIKYILGMED